MKTNEAVTALAALAQESRLEVFRLLSKLGAEGLPAGMIAEKVSIPPATLSFHLKELSHAGLVESRKEGRSVIYAINVKGVSCLMGFLTEDCCQGRPELCVPACCDKPAKKETKQRQPSRKALKK
ncbi:ArsR/SmtB family transcription factor [Aporhodopirellula aestuarii]|uniref:Metalloregulator ArsR/SmtB family transcription factor n=1 Tax=Aporhodopirellula aestuarii TaxID=2950107 RepID=A0ABT0U635_9BACT|nr:metalloregulator ArsR/SmtB family transcription factor [Aporhodopirellula aestuarii]MCM2372306.1 metalloregulator ArsR/SmtB family transcription factor [Aporhodopirellula aestuarii]